MRRDSAAEATDAERPPKRQRTRSTYEERATFGAPPYMTCLGLMYAIAIGLAVFVNQHTPRVTPVSGPNDAFSEGRALAHVTALTDLGVRLVGTPEVDAAAKYLLSEGQKLVLAAEKNRPDLLVQVSQEYYSGAMASSFLNTEYVNMYNNITNIILVVSPRTGLEEKSVLLNAHFDSAMGSPGASDDASCVGIMLELARLLIADSSRKLSAPVVFLMNGAEEAFCPASHAFMQQSPWARNLGVFLNLESTGNQGPDFVFQQTGAWPMHIFYKSAPHPRGSVVAQDIFQLGIIPADTDYRFFSANVQGSLPGLDMAFLNGAGAYHTDRDTVENIREGTIQAMGENALAFVIEAGKELTSRGLKEENVSDTQRVVFFDIFGKYMVMYPFKQALFIHTAPLVVAASLPFLQGRALRPQIPLPKLYGLVMIETGRAFVCMITTVLAALFMGLARVALFGTPMSWNAQPALAYLFLVPAAVAGALLPYLGSKVDRRIAATGNVWALAIFSAVTIHCGLGMGHFTTVWAIAGMVPLTDWAARERRVLRNATLAAIIPMLVFMPTTISLSLYMLQKASFLGAQGQPHFTAFIADGVAAALVGLCVVALLGFLPPWIAHAYGKRGTMRLVLMLLVASASVGGWISLAKEPYSWLTPKRVFVQHLHRVQANGSLDSVFAVGAVDAIPVDSLLANQRVALSLDSENSTGLEKAYVDAEAAGWEWQTTYPFNEEFVNGIVLQDSQQHTSDAIPRVELLNEIVGAEGSNPGSKRLHLQLNLQDQPLFGAVNLTGPLLDWSFPKFQNIPPQGVVHSRYVRFCGRGREEDWQFWVDVPQQSALIVRLSAAHLSSSPAIDDLTATWPPWTFVAAATTYASEEIWT